MMTTLTSSYMDTGSAGCFTYCKPRLVHSELLEKEVRGGWVCGIVISICPITLGPAVSEIPSNFGESLRVDMFTCHLNCLQVHNLYKSLCKRKWKLIIKKW